MGYRKVPRIYTLTFEGDLEGLIVRTKSVKFGKIRKLLTLLDDENGKDDDALEAITNELLEAIVSWNIEDEDGPVEVTREAIDDLEYEEVLEIVNKWLDQMTGPSKDLGKGSSSGETFPGQPLTMEAL